MEYLEGETLAQRLQRRGPLPWAEARHVVLQICDALRAAHDKGVIHRDMKPDNVFLVDRSGDASFVKVLDFGIAKIVSEHAHKNLTQTGMVMGTAAYMSPEQAQSLDLDARTDVYAIGIMLYELLTGRVPFDAGGFLGVVAKHLTERVPSMRRVAPQARISASLDRAVLRALRKDRDERWSSVEAFAEALRTIGDGRSPPSRGGSPRALWARSRSRRGCSGRPPLASAMRRRPPKRPSSTRRPSKETLAAVEPVAGEAESKSDDEPVDVHPDSPGPIATPTSPQEAIDPPPPTPLSEEVRPTARAARRRVPAPDPVVDRLSAARIDRELKKVRRRLAACAQEHFPLDKVRVKVSVSVRADGTVSDVSVADPHGRFPLGRCVARTIRSVRFPAAREATKTTRHIVLE
jgi:serine/threonine-protein kinase